MARLYHFSEDPGIEHFVPHVVATRVGEDPLVWAVDDEHAYIYYFPRECPRVTFYASPQTTPEDIERFFGHSTARRVVAIESVWLATTRETELYRYELDDARFELQDENAGYWISKQPVTPLSVEPVGDLLTALTEADAEVRVMPSLWPLYEAVISSTLGFSIIRWRNASPPQGVRSDA